MNSGACRTSDSSAFLQCHSSHWPLIPDMKMSPEFIKYADHIGQIFMTKGCILVM